MSHRFIELVVGSLEEKRAWRQMMQRVNHLPGDYRFTYRKILHYCYHFSCTMSMLTGLLELFEESAAAGTPVLDVVGSDVAAFCDGLMAANGADPTDARETLNREILAHFAEEEGQAWNT